MATSSLMSSPTTPPADDGRAPSLWLRFASMIYEAVLLFGVVFIVSYALLSAARWTYPLMDSQRWVLQVVLFITIGAYFAWCWSRGGQTLAMKSWGLRVVAAGGGRLSLGRAALRYVLAWHLLVPGLVFIALFQTHAVIDLLVFAGGFIAMLFTAQFDPRRQLLHDRLLGTRVLRDRPR
jgi:uncharacterized RDD family membrane protein YckC